jgi:hypothetical protein
MGGLKVIAEGPVSGPHHFQVMGAKNGINGLSLFVTTSRQSACFSL